ncbi:hypothetical protein ONO23_02786 [Micromonospora noduli]|nr:hypothetical protein ONO23_02786 [Micromonospora noduli]
MSLLAMPVPTAPRLWMPYPIPPLIRLLAITVPEAAGPTEMAAPEKPATSPPTIVLCGPSIRMPTPSSAAMCFGSVATSVSSTITSLVEASMVKPPASAVPVAMISSSIAIFTLASRMAGAVATFAIVNSPPEIKMFEALRRSMAGTSADPLTLNS